MTTANRTAYSYVRFSSSPQEKGDSIRRQTELSNAYAAKHDLVIDTTLNLHDLGVSAYKGLNATKGALGVFLKAVKKGRVKANSFLLVESFDRLSRETPLDALDQFKEIIDSGVTIVTLSDDKTYSKDSIKKDSMALMYTVMVMARAHEESEIKSQRLKAAWNTKRKNANDKILTARCPGWLKVKADRTGFDLIVENVAVVREILELTSRGMGQSQIVKLFNQRKQKPFGHGKGWHSSSIQKILTSPALYGDFHLGKYENGKKVLTSEIISNYYPALITKEDFYLIQSGRKLRMEPGGRTKKGTTVSNLFSGLLKCGYCGGGMTLIGSSAKRRKDEAGNALTRLGRRAVACNNGIRGIRCWAVQWGYSDFETSFLHFCREIEIAKLVDRLDDDAKPHSSKLELVDRKRAVAEELLALVTGQSNLIDVLATTGSKGSKGLTERLVQIEIDIEEKQALLDKLDIDILSEEAFKARDIAQARDLKLAISKIDTLSEEKLFLFRLSLAEHIRNLIKVITVFPAGTIHKKEEIPRIRASLSSQGHTESQIDEIIAQSFKTEPLRTSRSSRGRYNAKDSGREFSVETKSGNFLTIRPRKNDPASIDFFLNAKSGGYWLRGESGLENVSFETPWTQYAIDSGIADRWQKEAQKHAALDESILTRQKSQ